MKLSYCNKIGYFSLSQHCFLLFFLNQHPQMLLSPCLHQSPSRLCLLLLSQLVINGFNLQRGRTPKSTEASPPPLVCICVYQTGREKETLLIPVWPSGNNTLSSLTVRFLQGVRNPTLYNSFFSNMRLRILKICCLSLFFMYVDMFLHNQTLPYRDTYQKSWLIDWWTELAVPLIGEYGLFVNNDWQDWSH